MYTHGPYMLLDTSLLRRAKIENLERLAKSLGVDVPRRRRDGAYASQLVSAVATKIRRDAMMDELRKLTGLGLGASAPSANKRPTRVVSTQTRQDASRREEGLRARF